MSKGEMMALHLLCFVVAVGLTSLLELGEVNADAGGIPLLVSLGAQPNAIKLDGAVFVLGINIRVVPGAEPCVSRSSPPVGG